MPTTRYRKTRNQRYRVSDEARQAFQAGDHERLHHVLGLKPWEVSPLDAVGPCPYSNLSSGGQSWQQAVDLRRELAGASS